MDDTLRSTTNPHNPIPIYPPVNTSFPEPTVEVKVGEGNPRMTVIAIDHLPTLVSTPFSNAYIITTLQLTELLLCSTLAAPRSLGTVQQGPHPLAPPAPREAERQGLDKRRGLVQEEDGRGRGRGQEGWDRGLRQSGWMWIM